MSSPPFTSDQLSWLATHGADLLGADLLGGNGSREPESDPPPGAEEETEHPPASGSAGPAGGSAAGPRSGSSGEQWGVVVMANLMFG